MVLFFFFFNDTATTEIYTLSLHDALPIYETRPGTSADRGSSRTSVSQTSLIDRKSTRLNSSHSQISYAVFCLKKKHHPGQCVTRRTERSHWHLYHRCKKVG